MPPDPPYKKLIAGYDGSDRAADGLALAELLAEVTGAELLVVAVVPHEFPYAPGTPEREEVLRSQAEDMLADAVAESDRVHARVSWRRARPRRACTTLPSPRRPMPSWSVPAIAARSAACWPAPSPSDCFTARRAPWRLRPPATATARTKA